MELTQWDSKIKEKEDLPNYQLESLEGSFLPIYVTNCRRAFPAVVCRLFVLSKEALIFAMLDYDSDKVSAWKISGLADHGLVQRIKSLSVSAAHR